MNRLIKFFKKDSKNEDNQKSAGQTEKESSPQQPTKGDEKESAPKQAEVTSQDTQATTQESDQQKKIEDVARFVNQNTIEHHPGLVRRDSKDKPEVKAAEAQTNQEKNEKPSDQQQAPSVENTSTESQNVAKEQLEQLMQKQKKRESLVEQGILENGDVASALQSNKKELERNMASDKVDQGLRHRPSKAELTESGVIKEGADSLQGALQALELENKKIALNHKLAERHSPEELQEKQIIETDETIAEKKQRRGSAAEVIAEQLQKQANLNKKE